MGRQTEFGVYVEDDEDHQIKSVEFTDADGTAYGPFTKMSSTYDVVNFKTINFNVGEEPPFDDVSFFIILKQQLCTKKPHITLIRSHRTLAVVNAGYLSKVKGTGNCLK